MTLIERLFGDHRRFPAARAMLLGCAALSVLAIAACEDPLATTGTYTNQSQTFTVYALSGTPLNAPVAIYFAGRSVVRADGNFAFDIAFDINAEGRAIVLPVGLVGTPIDGSYLVGMQRVAGTFETVTEAPRSGYVVDSTQVVAAGEVIVVQSQSPIVCSSSATAYLFAKIGIDSINQETRAIHGHALINLNCGFRQLTTGVPTF